MENNTVEITTLITELDLDNNETRRSLSHILWDELNNWNTISIDKVDDIIKSKLHDNVFSSSALSNYLKTVITDQKKSIIHPNKKLSTDTNLKIVSPTVFWKKNKKDQADLCNWIIWSQSKKVKVQLYKMLIEMTRPDTKFKISDSFNPLIFSSFTEESQKLIADYHFRRKCFEDKPELSFKTDTEQTFYIEKKKNKVIENFTKIWDFEEDLLQDAIWYGLPIEVWMVWNAFKWAKDPELARIKGKIQWMNEENDQIAFKELFEIFEQKNSEYKESINDIFEDIEVDDSPETIEVPVVSLSWKEVKQSKEKKKPTLPFNPLLSDVPLSAWIKQVWAKQFKELFTSFYWKISNKIIDKVWWIQPTKTHIQNVLMTDIDDDNKNWERSDFLTFEWRKDWKKDIDFDERLWWLWVLYKSLIEDVKLHKMKKYVDNYRVWFGKPLSWKNQFKGYFREWLHFWGWNISLYKNWLDEQLLQAVIKDELSMTDITYLTIQIWYYLVHWKLLKKEEVYKMIFNEYILDQNKAEEIHDITIFKEQYEQFFENVIRPLSKEWQKIWLQPQNTLLTWSAGTWKTQFLLNLLLKDSFTFNWNSVELNAIVISLEVAELLHIMTKDKTMINSIVEKTGMPLVLVVEDIDTLMKEWRSAWWDSFSQKLTTLMTWVWSDKIITHVKSYIDQMNYFSTSYIAKFVKSIANRKIFNKKMKKNHTINEDEINALFQDIIIPVKTIKNKEEDLSKRIEALKNKNVNTKTIWY